MRLFNKLLSVYVFTPFSFCFDGGISDLIILASGPEVIKKIHAHSAEHEILNANKYKNIKKINFFRPI